MSVEAEQVMFEYERLNQIFDTVQEAAYIPATQLASLCHVSTRTIRTDVSRLNDKLRDNGAQIVMHRGMGYRLEISDNKLYKAYIASLESYKDNRDLSSAPNRLRTLLSILLRSDSYITVEDLAGQIFVEESTIQSYLRQARAIMIGYGIECVNKRGRGMRIFGREADRRDCFAHEVIRQNLRSYVTGFSTEEQMMIANVDLYQLQAIFNEHLKDSTLVTTDAGAKNIMLHLALAVSRVKAGYVIEGESTRPDNAEGWEFVNDISNDLERVFGIKLSFSERYYAYRHVMLNAHTGETSVADMPDFEDKVTQLLEVIFQNYGYDLRTDETLHTALINHLTSIFKAVELNNPYKNPLLNTIQTSFPLVYEITLMSSSEVFTEEPYTLDEDSVGYLSLHIGAAIERLSAKDATNRLWVFVVCSSGKAALSMLTSRIESYFGDKIEVKRSMSYREYLSLSEHEFAGIAFIITTVPLDNSARLSVLVDFRFGSSNIKFVSRLIESLDSDRFRKLERFFARENFMVVNGQTDKRTLIRQMCDGLEREGMVDLTFFDSVMLRESISDTSMNRQFAIPHSMKPEALHKRIAVAILKRPIAWSDEHQQIKIVFLLAIKAGDHFELESLYDLLVRIVEDSRLQQELAEVKDFNELMQVLAAAI
ncbi:BglG family transcription antiterminator [uncultured Olegusella sp.]|uniref:BglG family transcription antiterminator n=1 Tax=uncultured Olegusella sp. TaxID=1979846 RepID=UPI00262A04B5|nr:BglG family transcription antiterminator [uncultured Olegusella sp.]